MCAAVCAVACVAVCAVACVADVRKTPCGWAFACAVACAAGRAVGRAAGRVARAGGTSSCGGRLAVGSVGGGHGWRSASGGWASEAGTAGVARAAACGSGGGLRACGPAPPSALRRRVGAVLGLAASPPLLRPLAVARDLRPGGNRRGALRACAPAPPSRLRRLRCRRARPCAAPQPSAGSRPLL